VIPIRETPDGATFAIRVQPGAKKTAITGIYGEGKSASVKLSLTAPPIDGRANQAVIEFFSEVFAVPRSQIRLLSGEKSRGKIVCVADLSAVQLQAILRKHLPAS
jgi:uncharacterized protein